MMDGLLSSVHNVSPCVWSKRRRRVHQKTEYVLMQGVGLSLCYSDKQTVEPYLVLLCNSLEVVHEQILVLWQQGEHHSQPIENQQEAFRQRSLVCPRHAQTKHSLWPDNKTVAFLREQITGKKCVDEGEKSNFSIIYTGSHITLYLSPSLTSQRNTFSWWFTTCINNKLRLFWWWHFTRIDWLHGERNCIVKVSVSIAKHSRDCEILPRLNEWQPNANFC